VTSESRRPDRFLMKTIAFMAIASRIDHSGGLRDIGVDRYVRFAMGFGGSWTAE